MCRSSDEECLIICGTLQKKNLANVSNEIHVIKQFMMVKLYRRSRGASLVNPYQIGGV